MSKNVCHVFTRIFPSNAKDIRWLIACTSNKSSIKLSRFLVVSLKRNRIIPKLILSLDEDRSCIGKLIKIRFLMREKATEKAIQEIILQLASFLVGQL